MEKYSRDFNITGGGLMKTFLGMEIEQSNRSIKLHLDHYIREMLNEYKVYNVHCTSRNRATQACSFLARSHPSSGG